VFLKSNYVQLLLVLVIVALTFITLSIAKLLRLAITTQSSNNNIFVPIKNTKECSMQSNKTRLLNGTQTTQP